MKKLIEGFAAGLGLGLRMMPLLAGALLARAEDFKLDWFTVDAGGGSSSGGAFAVSGAVGQPESGQFLTNGRYAVQGGFWALPFAVPSEGAPTLLITPGQPGTVVISWVPTPKGFVLQEATSLSPANWANTESGITNQAIVTTGFPAKYYRLFKP